MQEHLMDTLNGNLPPQNATPNTPWGMEPPAPPPGMTPPVNGHEFPPLSMITSSTSDTLSTGVGGPGTPGSMGSTGSAAAAAAAKKSSSRRNAWGNLSYADLITQAIQSTPEKRLTLSQVYEWMVANIPYFKDKGDSNSSAGWKVRRWFL